MNGNLNRLFLPVASTSLLLLGACGDDESLVPDNADLLVGDWSLKSVDGEELNNDEYSVTFTFEADGDFTFCSRYESGPSTITSCLDGDWELNDNLVAVGYTGEDEDSVDIDSMELTITKLTADQLEGSWGVVDEEDASELSFERID